jgi:hypothetical protein
MYERRVDCMYVDPLDGLVDQVADQVAVQSRGIALKKIGMMDSRRREWIRYSYQYHI